MTLTQLDHQSVSGIAVELYQDSFSGQYTVEAAGWPVYDTCEQGKAQGVYDLLVHLPREVLGALIDHAMAG